MHLCFVKQRLFVFWTPFRLYPHWPCCCMPDDFCDLWEQDPWSLGPGRPSCNLLFCASWESILTHLPSCVNKTLYPKEAFSIVRFCRDLISLPHWNGSVSAAALSGKGQWCRVSHVSFSFVLSHKWCWAGGWFLPVWKLCLVLAFGVFGVEVTQECFPKG